MSNVVWSVSYYVPGERYWQFAGEGDKAWADRHADYLRRTMPGFNIRMKWRGTGEPIAAIEA